MSKNELFNSVIFISITIFFLSKFPHFFIHPSITEGILEFCMFRLNKLLENWNIGFLKHVLARRSLSSHIFGFSKHFSRNNCRVTRSDFVWLQKDEEIFHIIEVELLFFVDFYSWSIIIFVGIHPNPGICANW